MREREIDRMERILVVDDDKDLRLGLSDILKDEGFDVLAVEDGKSALKAVKKDSPNLVLLDIRLAGTDGMKVLEEMKRIDKNLIIIMLTAYGEVRQSVKAMKLGAVDYITKPFDSEELVLIIKKALETQCLSREVEQLRRKLGEKSSIEEIMGESPQIKQVLKKVEVVAPTNMTVILQGESGTGKEVMAEVVHQRSLRKENPFVAIDCGAIPEGLFESELFGYEKGAFTGADDRKEGKFEQADRGTLFLDEINNLTITMQVKFLRVIEERRLYRLGGNKEIKIDVRIIVATSANLLEAVRIGKFRDDLFHRLNEFHIVLPSLSQRKEDIPILAKYFIDEANTEFSKKIKGFSSDAMRFLLDYSWPGNVRELKNLIKRATLLTEQEFIPKENLFADPSTVTPLEIPKSQDEKIKFLTGFKDKTKEFEKGLIEEALEKSGGNKIKAAEILQMNRKMLYRKMKSL